MELDIPKYLLYFNLEGITSYNESEFITIKKIMKNILNSRYYTLDIQIQFNNEIINYESIKKELQSNNIMLLMGHIDEELVEDIIYEVSSIIGTDNPIRRKSYNDFNATGYTDEQLSELYKQIINESQEIKVIEEEYTGNFKILASNFIFFNISYLDQSHYISFCNLLIKNADNLDCFEMLQDLNVCEALFKNFKYLIKYISLLDLDAIIRYYNKDTIKILRSLRTYVKQSEDSNDNIKELLLHKFFLNKFNISKFLYDPEEGFNQIREEIYNIINIRNNELIEEFESHVNLFKDNHDILTVGDDNTKVYKAHKTIAINLKKHFEKLKPLIKSFRSIDDNFLQFNSKLNNQERINITLDRFMKARIIKDYQEKFGLYKITIESSEHIPFLQGKWFEYYTASVCEDIIENYKKQGFFPDYKIYQNVVVNINGYKRELDIIIYLNGKVFYIENKIENRNSIKNDILKYQQNSESMNITSNNCYIVYLEGEDRLNEAIKVCNLQTFISKFKKEALKILEEDKNNYLLKMKEKELKEKQEREINKILEKEMRSLYLSNFVDYEEEEQRINKLIYRFKEESKKIQIPSNEDFFDELNNTINSIKDKILNQKYEEYKAKYKDRYFSNIKKHTEKNIYKDMLADLKNFGYERELSIFYERLLCLNENFEEFFSISNRTLVSKLIILCGYATNTKEYLNIIGAIMLGGFQLGSEASSYLLVSYIDRIKPLHGLDAIELFSSIIIDYAKQFSLNSNDFKNAKEQFLAARKEKEFLCVLIYEFAIKHLKKYNLKGLVIEETSKFIINLLQNQETFIYKLKDLTYGKSIITLDPIKDFFSEDNFIDLSSYLFLNYRVLKNEFNTIRNSKDNNYIFEGPRNEIIAKFLKLSQSAGIIANYKEIKKADKYIAIFSNDNYYKWLVNYYWVGVYLAFTNESGYDYTNIMINNNMRLLFIKEINNKLIVCLSKFINEMYLMNILVTNKTNLNKVLRNLNDSDFIYRVDNIIEEISKILEEEGKNETK